MIRCRTITVVSNYVREVTVGLEAGVIKKSACFKERGLSELNVCIDWFEKIGNGLGDCVS